MLHLPLSANVQKNAASGTYLILMSASSSASRKVCSASHWFNGVHVSVHLSKTFLKAASAKILHQSLIFSSPCTCWLSFLTPLILFTFIIYHWFSFLQNSCLLMFRIVAYHEIFINTATLQQRCYLAKCYCQTCQPGGRISY